MKDSSLKQFVSDAHYWIEIIHKDTCDHCQHMNQDHCVSASYNATHTRTRVAQFVYFQEAIDYAVMASKNGLMVWLRKPRYASDKIYSEYSIYQNGGLFVNNSQTV